MGYPTQGHIAKDVAELKKLVQECESEIDRIKQLAVRNGELIREVLKKLES
jgi:flagellar biosynthesis/type III secretory pathway chaperone